MAYCKLTQSTLDLIVSELKTSVQHHRRLCSAGIRLRSFSLRAICENAGISHTTFYRWMRAYRSLKHKKRLTDTEKRLRAFGKAVDAVYRDLEVVNETLTESPCTRLPSMSKPCRKEQVEGHQPHPQTDISEIEARTDALTGGIRCVKFAPIKSLKNM